MRLNKKFIAPLAILLVAPALLLACNNGGAQGGEGGDIDVTNKEQALAWVESHQGGTVAVTQCELGWGFDNSPSLSPNMVDAIVQIADPYVNAGTSTSLSSQVDRNEKVIVITGYLANTNIPLLSSNDVKNWIEIEESVSSLNPTFNLKYELTNNNGLLITSDYSPHGDDHVTHTLELDSGSHLLREKKAYANYSSNQILYTGAYSLYFY